VTASGTGHGIFPEQRYAALLLFLLARQRRRLYPDGASYRIMRGAADEHRVVQNQ